jgi:hypothetical protein
MADSSEPYDLVFVRHHLKDVTTGNRLGSHRLQPLQLRPVPSMRKPG